MDIENGHCKGNENLEYQRKYQKRDKENNKWEWSWE